MKKNIYYLASCIVLLGLVAVSTPVAYGEHGGEEEEAEMRGMIHETPPRPKTADEARLMAEKEKRMMQEKMMMERKNMGTTSRPLIPQNKMMDKMGEGRDQKNMMRGTSTHMMNGRAMNPRDHILKTAERLEKHVAHMEGIITRLESRIKKLETEKGVRIEEGKTLIAEAKTKLSLAKTSIEALKSKASSTTASTTPRETVTKVKELAESAIKGVKEAHQALVKAIASINAKIKTEVRVPPRATTTNTTASPTTTQ